jgi:hypothetical protein
LRHEMFEAYWTKHYMQDWSSLCAEDSLTEL